MPISLKEKQGVEQLTIQVETLQDQLNQQNTALRGIVSHLKELELFRYSKQRETERGIDLVDFGDFKLFMHTNDHLYDTFVNQRDKGCDLEKHYDEISVSGYKSAPVNRSNVESVTDAALGFYVLLNHLIQHYDGLTFIDVGSFVGDVAMRYANFFRTIGHDGKVICFDPTIAGTLTDHNAALNGLDDYIEYHPKAVSDISGPLMFTQKTGHTDSSHSTMEIKGKPNAIFQSIKLSDFIKANKISNLFVKLDAEGMDFRIINDILPLLKNRGSSFAFEFIIEKHYSNRDFVLRLMNDYYLLDVGYLQKPAFFNLIRPEALDDYVTGIMTGRRWGFTDMVAVSKKTPLVEWLLGRLTNLSKRAIEYKLA